MSFWICNTLPQFIGVRALFAICMGGLVGLAVGTALEDLPYDSRGIASGVFNIGNPVGYLLATPIYRAWVPTHGWKPPFWFASGAPLLIIAWHLYLSETNSFQILKAARENTGPPRAEVKQLPPYVLGEANRALRDDWILSAYMVVLMTAFTAQSNASPSSATLTSPSVQ